MCLKWLFVPGGEELEHPVPVEIADMVAEPPLRAGGDLQVAFAVAALEDALPDVDKRDFIERKYNGV